MPLTKPSGIITLLSDLGLEDPSVGVLKGIILARFSEARLVDLCHRIPPGDTSVGARFLADAHRVFPSGTVHLVAFSASSERATSLIAEADGHYFVAPDRGLLAGVLGGRRFGDYELRALDPIRLGPPPEGAPPAPGPGIDWRDRLAPAAAEIAAGRRWLSELGPPVLDGLGA